MEYSIDKGLLTIQLPERMTADLYTEIRGGIMDILNANSVEKLCLDAQNTQYISSSGLRIVMELLKKYRDMTIVNASLDVYEVFELTGISELMKITKAKKRLSVDGCKIIGKGANGTVYRYNEDTIVKVYTKPDVREEDIEREHLLARKAFVLGVPTALTLDTVTVEGHLGAMYEMIGADAVLDLIYKNRDSFEKYLIPFAEGMKLINGLHTDKDPILADKKAEYAAYIKEIEAILTPAELLKLAKLMAAIPEEDTLIHGDYHFGNVMIQGDELILIDMDTLGYGSKLIELGNLYYTLFGVNALFPDNAFYNLSQEEKERCWQIITDYIYEGKEPAEKERELELAKALTCVRTLRYGVRHDAPEDRMEYVKGKLLERIEKYC